MAVSGPTSSLNRTLKPDALADLGAELLGDAFRDRTGRDAPRLGVADPTTLRAPTRLQAQLGQLRRLTRPRLARHDQHLVRADGREEVPRGAR